MCVATRTVLLLCNGSPLAYRCCMALHALHALFHPTTLLLVLQWRFSPVIGDDPRWPGMLPGLPCWLLPCSAAPAPRGFLGLSCALKSTSMLCASHSVYQTGSLRCGAQAPSECIPFSRAGSAVSRAQHAAPVEVRHSPQAESSSGLLVLCTLCVQFPLCLRLGDLQVELQRRAGCTLIAACVMTSLVHHCLPQACSPGPSIWCSI